MAPRRKRQRLDEPLGIAQPSTTGEKSADELRLEAELFAFAPQQVDGPTLRETEGAEDDLEEVADDQLFFVDEAAPVASTSTATAPKASAKKSGKAPLWQDPADEAVTVSLKDATRLRKLRTTAEEDVVGGKEYTARLKKQFEKTNPAPKWATTARKEAMKRKERAAEDPDGVSSILRQAGAGTRSRKGGQLKAGELHVTRLKDANVASNSKSQINSVGFHPEVQVLFTAAQDRRLRLYTIDGTHNPLLQTIHCSELPIQEALFNPSGERIVLVGNRPYFFTYDLQSGRTIQSRRGLWNEGLGGSDTELVKGSLAHPRFSPDGSILAVTGRRGYVHLLDSRAPGSGQVLGQLRVPSGEIAGIAWSGDGTTITTASKDADVYAWDVRTQTCVSRWRDEGGFGTCAVESDASGEYMAVGSTTGIVNVYDAASLPSASEANAMGVFPERKPLKAVGNLTTEITSMRFNSDSSILALASNKKKDQLKLVHRPSLTVFSNWPTASTPLGTVTALAFSRASEYLAIANEKGSVLLYSLDHFARRRT